jgi:transcriptional regulator with XRE-family HTH domain
VDFFQLFNRQLKAKKMSIREVARQADIDPSLLAKVLRGERNPPNDEKIVRRLAKVLSVDPCHLLLSVGRIPLDWKTQLGRPETLRALERVFEYRSSAEMPTAEEPSIRASVRDGMRSSAKPKPARTETEPLRVPEPIAFLHQRDMSEDLL